MKKYSGIEWKTSREEYINVYDMKKHHIINTLNCLRGRGGATIPNCYEGRTKAQWITIFSYVLSSEPTKEIYPIH